MARCYAARKPLDRLEIRVCTDIEEIQRLRCSMVPCYMLMLGDLKSVSSSHYSVPNSIRSSSSSPMADASALCVSPASFLPSLRSHFRSTPSSSTRFFLSTPTGKAQFRLKSRANGSDAGGVFGDDPYGPYPWESSFEPTADSEIQWIQEERVTLFTSEGLIQIGGSLVPRRFPTSDESNYMDPDQGLCLGALFNIAATNGLDMGRRLCIFGFCRSIEMLSDVVEDTVLEHGGEVVTAEKASTEGLQEKLKMTVAVPLLWGVPPASETLRFAVRNGGGIVEKVYWQWDFL